MIYVAGATRCRPIARTQVTRALRLAAPKAVLLISDLEPEQPSRPGFPGPCSPRTTVDLRLGEPARSSS